MTTFNFLRRRLLEKGDKKELLALVIGKLDDIINTTVRQISFSDFERTIHAHDPSTMTRGKTRRFSPEDFDAAWLDVTRKYYGDPGEVFEYENIEHLWAYVHHFHRPFYVYAYAFGELLTHSLYAKKDALGERFEPLYLDLLRSAGTREVAELLKPFGLDPTDPNFWADGIKVSIGALLDEAEALTKELGL
jgi:oligoendopeptidase F